MELWIPITIAAAFLQNLRTAAQKKLQGSLGTTGASFVRFGFGFPLALAYLAGLHYLGGLTLPPPTLAFVLWCMIGGVAQIAATILLVYMFTQRNFAVGTAYSKTEPVQAALFAMIILGEQLSQGALIAIVVGIMGVMLISVARAPMTWRGIGSALISRTAGIGVLSGALFAVAAVAFRTAGFQLDTPDPIVRAAMALAFATVFQTIIMVIWIAAKDITEFRRVALAWRSSTIIGVTSVVGSACWFTAMALQQVAYVRALGQIELIFTFASSVFLFKETINRLEVAGCLLIVSGILTLLLTP